MADCRRPPLYYVWRNMIRRCEDPHRPEYPRYGGRGIKVCASWRASFRAFAADMGPRPSSSHQIERKENAGDYEPSNCVWATRTQQARNRRRTKYVEFKGQTRSVPEWADILRIPQDTLYHRLENWPVEKALTEPLNIRQSRRAAS